MKRMLLDLVVVCLIRLNTLGLSRGAVDSILSVSLVELFGFVWLKLQSICCKFFSTKHYTIVFKPFLA
jgi:hypothetical protein